MRKIHHFHDILIIALKVCAYYKNDLTVQNQYYQYIFNIVCSFLMAKEANTLMLFKERNIMESK